jgi:hypothetical protein
MTAVEWLIRISYFEHFFNNSLIQVNSMTDELNNKFVEQFVTAHEFHQYSIENGFQVFCAKKK